MQKVHFSTFINAPVEKVWNTMLESDTYQQWTKAFNPDSRFKGDWSEGSKMLFIGEMDGKEGGMISRVKENRQYEYLSLEHYGIIENGVEKTSGPEVEKWAPNYENYTFVSKDGGTEVQVDMDIDDEFKDEFSEMWPKALQKLKELAES